MNTKELFEKVKFVTRKYTPEIIGCAGVAGLISARELNMRKQAQLQLAQEMIFKNYKSYRTRAFRILHTNNWLKRHHEPMKRRGV